MVADVPHAQEPGIGQLGPVLRDLVRRVGADMVLLVVADQMVVSLGVPAAESAAAESWSSAVPLPADGFVGRVLCSGRAAVEPLDAARDGSLGTSVAGAPLLSAAGAPVSWPGGPPGALCAGFADGPVRDPETILWIVESYARLAALCLHEAGAVDGLLASARIDGLTGCPDYAAIREELDREISRSARRAHSLSCAFIDLDGFKRVNDRHGHPFGNEVLAEIAEILRASMRIGDTIGRYGGDEFVAILPDTDLSAAHVLAERVRSMVSTATLRNGRVHLDASVGIAQWQPGMTVDGLLADADRALLDAKRAGGGIVCSVHGPAAWTARSSCDADRAHQCQPISERRDR